MCYYCDLFENAKFRIKPLDPRAKVPTKREEDSGYDVYGIIEQDYILLKPNQNVIIGTGLAMEFPKGLGFIVANRGSLGTKSAIVGASVVDSGYRGEVLIDLHNISDQNMFFTDLTRDELLDLFEKSARIVSFIHGMSIDVEPMIRNAKLIPKSKALTQGMIIPTWHLPVEVLGENEELSSSDRKDGRLGSTNIVNN